MLHCEGRCELVIQLREEFLGFPVGGFEDGGGRA